MNKTKVTRRYLAANYNCKCVGYCDLWHLFRYFDGITHYTSGVYGWNFDAFKSKYCSRSIETRSY